MEIEIKFTVLLIILTVIFRMTNTHCLLLNLYKTDADTQKSTLLIRASLVALGTCVLLVQMKM